ncbi:MAG: hypothetical protein SWO11_16885 [Thermodesulfobacteriota bacterium]|nr:hypothetical protein [Thermodesulfobacteriota bacterium]
MDLKGNCRTTAMGVLPHTDPNKALDLALSLDVPFWPQLPLASFYEDMWVQTSEGFPGITVDTEHRGISFHTEKFMDELGEYAKRMAYSETYALTCHSSLLFHRFLNSKLDFYPAIRGQVTGPINFGFRIVDENKKPIIYNEEVKLLLYDFIQRKVNIQYRELLNKNRNCFIWLDEPGFGWVFTSLSGYNDLQAKEDYNNFYAGIEGPKALHLCLNVNLPYLLGLGLDILSINAYQFETMPRAYADPIARFIKSGGIIVWGIVPTCAATLEKETAQTLVGRLSSYWDSIAESSDISMREIALQALISPAQCCIKYTDKNEAGNNTGHYEPGSFHAPGIEERIVEKAFSYVRQISKILQDGFNL